MAPVRLTLLGLFLLGAFGCKEQEPHSDPNPCIWFGEPENPIVIKAEEFGQVDIDALDDAWPRPVCIRCRKTTKGSELHGILETLCLARGHFYIKLLGGDTIHFGYPLRDDHVTHPWYAWDWKPHEIPITISPRSYVLDQQPIEFEELVKQLGSLLQQERSSLSILIDPETPYSKVDTLLQTLHDQKIKYYSFQRML